MKEKERMAETDRAKNGQKLWERSFLTIANQKSVAQFQESLRHLRHDPSSCDRCVII